MIRNDTNEAMACTYLNLKNYICVSIFSMPERKINSNKCIIDGGIGNFTISYTGGKYEKKYANYSINSISLPTESNSLFICYQYYNSTYSSYLINCFKYNIETEQISYISKIETNKKKFNSLIIEYFYETNTIILGAFKDEYSFLFVEISLDINNNTNYIYNLNDFSKNNGDIGRVNVVFPSGAKKYHLYYNPNTICYIFCSGKENILQEIGQELNSITEYPLTEPITSEVCGQNYYYDYINKKCSEEIPVGFYLNDTKKIQLKDAI